MASEPFNIKRVQAPSDKVEILVMNDELPPFDIVDYRSDEEDKLINDVENLCRHSFTYQEWVQYLRNYMDMNKCSFFEYISNVDTTSIKIHLHHSPITLMEMVVTILEKRKFYKESLLIEAIAKEVMYVHYCTMVGIIPLCETVHELVHNQFIFVPNSAVMGNYKWFIDQYGPWIPTQVRNKYDNIEQWTKFYDEESNTNAIKAGHIDAYAVTAEKIAAGAITSDKLDTKAVMVSNLNDDVFEEVRRDVEAQINQYQAEVEQYMHFDTDTGLTLGGVGSDFAVNINNQEIGFKEGGNTVAYINNQKISITDGEVLNEMRIGNYVFKPRANGNMSLVYQPT